MASPDLTSALLELEDSSAAQKSKGYGELLTKVTQSPADSDDEQGENVVAYVDSLLASSLGIIAIRPLISNLIDYLDSSPSEIKVRVGAHLTTVLQPQLASFEEQDARVREILADGYEAEEEYIQAAKTLQGIQLDSTQRRISEVAKVRIWIRIVRCYIMEYDTVSAETALNKIKNSNAAVQVLQDHPDLQLHYQMARARVLDSRRDFLTASAEYLNVSFNNYVVEQDRLLTLSSAIKTAVLAPAGPQRSRLLARLYKDERSSERDEYSILESMFLDRLIPPAEVQAFAAKLEPHQLATTADGSTVLTKAVVEHNLIAASRLYENISTASLAQLLALNDSKGTTAAEKAEEYAARMVEQGRLKAEIDQIDGIVTFERIPGLALHGPDHERRVWDFDVQGLVEDVERCAAAVAEAFPVLAGPAVVG